MPVYKYRSVEETPDIPFATDPDEIVRRVRALWKRSSKLSPSRQPPGVYKYRNQDEARAQLEQWQRETRS